MGLCGMETWEDGSHIQARGRGERGGSAQDRAQNSIVCRVCHQLVWQYRSVPSHGTRRKDTWKPIYATWLKGWESLPSTTSRKMGKVHYLYLLLQDLLGVRWIHPRLLRHQLFCLWHASIIPLLYPLSFPVLGVSQKENKIVWHPLSTHFLDNVISGEL